MDPPHVVKHVVKVAVINGKRYELKELPEPIPSPIINRKVRKPHWSKLNFQPQPPRHAPTKINGNMARQQKKKCPIRRRFQKAPVFIKVIRVHERVVVDSHHHMPIYKVVKTCNRLYLKRPNKPLKRISGNASKKVFGNKEKMREAFERKQQHQKQHQQHQQQHQQQAKKMSGKMDGFKESDKQFIMFLLGLSSALCLFGVYKALLYLFSNDDAHHHKGGYGKLSMDEDKILLEVEEKAPPAPQTV